MLMGNEPFFQTCMHARAYVRTAAVANRHGTTCVRVRIPPPVSQTPIIAKCVPGCFFVSVQRLPLLGKSVSTGSFFEVVNLKRAHAHLHQ